MIFVPRLSYAKNASLHITFFDTASISLTTNYTLQRDTATLRKQRQAEEEKKKIKEVAKAKKMPKPEKVEDVDAKGKLKPKRQRRPDGLERPPEIPRRND
ncbi:hypothetical protein [Mucilaginibacter glaciei]|uniref:Uncharacterized protein n=1 Tax=Mucilaginibacter glaciei TaxID=2772109 RepID=A0A926NSN5_9SPHI|nr:hypothetical protein [Mucilaginibacter glaciei]MBD1393892.1 hypothetical protein [Mucilaginibacter glaciei]